MRKIKCQATRSDGIWVAHESKHGVFGRGSTLKAVAGSIEQGLLLIEVTAEVTVTPVTPELEKLRAAESARDAALRQAVTALARQQTAPGDIAQATGMPLGQVKLLLATTGKARGSRARPTG